MNKSKINQKINKRNLINKIYSKPPKRNNLQTTNVYQIDVIWSLGIIVLKDYGFEKKNDNRYVLVLIDNFSELGWTILRKNKNAQTKKESFGNNFDKCKMKTKFNRN